MSKKNKRGRPGCAKGNWERKDQSGDELHYGESVHKQNEYLPDISIWFSYHLQWQSERERGKWEEVGKRDEDEHKGTKGEHTTVREAQKGEPPTHCNSSP